MIIALKVLDPIDVRGVYFGKQELKKGVYPRSVFYKDLPEGEKFVISIKDAPLQILADVHMLAMERDDIEFVP